MQQIDETKTKYKNPNGEGSFRYKTDKLIEGRAMVNGKVIYVYVKANCKYDQNGERIGDSKAEREAKKKLEKAILKAEESGVVPNHLKLQDLIAEWISDKNEKNKLRPKTYGDYVSLIDTHIRNSVIGKTEIQKLTVKQLESFFLDKKKNGRIPKKEEEKEKKSLSLGTIKKMLTIIREALNYAQKNDYVERNVALLVELPNEEEKKNEYGEVVDEEEYCAFSPDERVTFLNQAKKSSSRSSIYITLLVMLFTGMRIGEALALKWRNVNLKRGEIYIRENFQRVKTPNGQNKTMLVVGQPKTSAGRRTIPIPLFLVDELIKHKENQQRDKQKWGEAYFDKDIVFSTENGNYREPRNLSRAFYNIRDKAGISPVNLHGLRHTYATMLFEKGVPAKTVSVLLGHKDINVTLNIYSHVFPEIKSEAIEVLPDYVSERIKSSFEKGITT